MLLLISSLMFYMFRTLSFCSVFFLFICCNSGKKTCDEIAAILVTHKEKDFISDADFELILKELSFSKCDSFMLKKLMATAYQIKHNSPLDKLLFVDILRLDSNDIYANFQLGKIYFNESKFDTSLMLFKRVINLHSNNGFAFEYNPRYLSNLDYLYQISTNEMLYYYAVALFRMNQFDDSEWYFQLLDSYNYNVDSVNFYLKKINHRN